MAQAGTGRIMRVGKVDQRTNGQNGLQRLLDKRQQLLF
jgi:hypothetical protein